MSPRTSRILIAGTIAAGVIAIGAFAVAGPLGDAGDSLSSGETDYEAVEGSRFTYGGGLDRTDFWSVAADQTLGSPLGGEGAGSFRSRYLLERDSDEAPRNAHSIWLETSGELGLIGLLLLVTALAMGVVGALRSRKLGPEAAALSTIALAVGGAWLGQASVDWSWFFGALTAPTLALLGAAAAPAALSFTVLGKTPKRLAMGTAALLCLIAIPTFASERLVLQASRGWPDDLEGAYSALDTAADLNPFADTPLLVESEIARRSGDPGRALEAAEAAAERDPEDWRARFLAAKALALYDPDDAYAKIDEGLALNPRSEELSNLLRRLDRPPASE